MTFSNTNKHGKPLINYKYSVRKLLAVQIKISIWMLFVYLLKFSNSIHKAFQKWNKMKVKKGNTKQNNSFNHHIYYFRLLNPGRKKNC